MGFSFSPDSRHWAAVIKTGGADVLLVDGQEIGRHPQIEMPSDSQLFIGKAPTSAYLAKEAQQGWGVYLDGEKLDAPSRRLAAAITIHAYALRAAGDEVAFWCAMEGYYGYYLVSPQDSYGPYPGREHDISKAVSPDWKRAAVSFPRDGHWFVACDGKEYGPFIGKPRMRFSPDGRHFAFVYKEEGRTGLYLDGRRAPEFGEAWSCEWSDDSSRLAVVTRKGERRVVIESGREGKAYNVIVRLMFSPDSKHLAYWAKNDEAWILVVDGIETLRCSRLGETGFVGGDLRGGCITRTEKGWELLKKAGDAKVSRRKWARHLRHMLFDMRLEDNPGGKEARPR